MGKALSQEDLYENVLEELNATYKAFLDSCPQESSFVEEQQEPVAAMLKSSCVVLFDLFSSKVGRSLDKCAVFTVKWYEHVRQVLGSQEVRQIVQNMPRVEVRNVVISVLSCYLESLWNVCLKFIMEKQGSTGGRRPVDLYCRIIPDNTVTSYAKATAV